VPHARYWLLVYARIAAVSTKRGITLHYPNHRRRILLALAVCTLVSIFTVSAKANAQSALVYLDPDAYPNISLKIAPAEAPYANVFLDMAPINSPVRPYVENGCTMVPIRALGESLGAQIGWDSVSKAATYSKSEVSLIVTIGTPTIETAGGRTIAMPQPAALVNGTTMVPLRLFSEILGYKVLWDASSRSVYITSTPGPLELWGFYALGSSTYSSWEDLFGAEYPYTNSSGLVKNTQGIFAGWFFVNQDGTITSDENPTGFQKPDGWPSVILESKRQGVKLFSMYFADQEHSSICTLLEDPVLRSKLAKEISAASFEYDGVLIDFEEIGFGRSAADSDMRNFNAFLDELHAFLEGKSLAVSVPPLNGSFKGYDHAHIGEIADSIVLMAYGYEDRSIPTSTAPFDKVDEAIRLEMEVVDPGKIILGVPAYGTLYATDSGKTYLFSKPPAKDLGTKLPEYSEDEATERSFAPEYLCNHIKWQGPQLEYEVFLEDAASFNVRINMAKRYGIKGVAVWRLGFLTKTVLALP